MNTRIKRILKLFIPNPLRYRLRLFLSREKYKKQIYVTQKHYKQVIECIKRRPNNQKNRFGMYVVFDSSFGGYELMNLMIQRNDYVKIVIIPDTSRGHAHKIEQYKKTKDFFVNKYGEEYVLDGYDESSDTYYDLSNEFDVIYLANPYDTMVSKAHGVEYLSTQNVLPIYISYGCMPDNYGCKIIMPLKEISLFWKVFSDTEYSLRDYKKFELLKGKNVVSTGYAKMDSLVNFTRKECSKKRIIIAPHHTINNKDFPLSNFLSYYDFILELPKMYPNIEFIFRPHPLLFINLENQGFWTHLQVKEYLQKIENVGMIYSVGGDYFDIFVNSDAIIHDCSSFVVEYLFTEKPCCFVAKKDYKKIFSNFGKACLNNYYLAFSKSEILKFIDDVVIAENDILKSQRIEFSSKELKLNFPNVSKKILEELTVK